MYQCQQCRKDVTLEVEAEITVIVNSLSLGQTPVGVHEYFAQRYVCKGCTKGDSGTSSGGAPGTGLAI